MPRRYATNAEVRAVLPSTWTDPPLTDALIDSVLALGQCVIGLSPWGECASQGHTQWAAHRLALHPEILAAGLPGAGQDAMLAGEANGPASRSFAVPASEAETGSDAWYRLTYWGRCYLELRAAVPRTGVLARTAC